MGVLVRWVDRHLRLTRRPQAEAGPARRTVPAETTQAPDQQRRTPARRRQWPTPPPALRPRPGPASTTRALREFPTGPLPTSSQVRSSSSRPAPDRLLGRTWTASKPPSLTARRFRRGAAGIAARARRCQAAWVSNQTEPRSWPAVRWTSALRAAARRRSRGMVGSVPPSSMRSMSSSVREARRASSATDRPRVVRTSYRALPKARASRIASRSGSSAGSSGRAQRVWSPVISHLPFAGLRRGAVVVALAGLLRADSAVDHEPVGSRGRRPGRQHAAGPAEGTVDAGRNLAV